jgi:uncharacterized protein (DUF3084 family)
VTEPLILPAPILELPGPPRTKWEREYQAFRQLRPQLLNTHRGQYVAIHNGQVVDSGNDKVALALRVLAKIGNVSIHVGLVAEEPEPIFRSGVRREVPLSGVAS